MQRKKANGRYTAEFKAHVLEWVVAEPGRSARLTAHHFELGDGTVLSWMRKAGVKGVAVEETSSRETTRPGGPPPTSRAKPKGQPGGRYRAPVEELGVEDRERAVRSVQTIAEIVDLGTTAMLERLKEALKARGQRGRHGLSMTAEEEREDAKLMARLMSISKDDSQAMLHLSRTQSLIIDTFPGVLKLAGVEEKTDTGRRRLDMVAKALGVKV